MSSIQDLRGSGSVTLSEAKNSLSMTKSGMGQMGNHGDSGMMADMVGLRALFPEVGNSKTVYALNGGKWSDPDTWSTGEIPGDGDTVYIPRGVSVVYDDVIDARLDTVAVDGGLHFAVNTDTRLLVDTLVTGAASEFTMGQDGNPIQKGVTAEIIIHSDSGPINRSDSSQLEKGIVTHGSVRIAGQDKEDFLRTAVDPKAGDKALVFDDFPTGWEVGDKLVVAGTKLVGKNSFEDEVVTIESITKLSNGNYSVKIDQALRYDHVPPENSAGVDFSVPVANYTRNVFIGSETDGDQYLSDGKTVAIEDRGHVMFMHNPDVSVQNAEFYELGRTDKSEVLDPDGGNVAGRYALHFHRTGTDGKAALAEGNAVWGSPGWGLVHHDANLDVISNAVYGVNGGAIIAEAGNEIGIWADNITINTTGDYITFNSEHGNNSNHPAWRQDALDDSFHQGIGYGFKSRLIESHDNVAVSSNGAGYSFWPMGIDGGSPSNIDPDAADYEDQNGYDPFFGRETVSKNGVPIRFFTGNESIVAHVGFNTSADKRPTGTDVMTVIEDFTAWEVTQGFGGFYQENYILKDSVLIGVEDGVTQLMKNTPAGPNSVGIMAREFHELALVNNHIENFDYGVWEKSHDLRNPGVYIIVGNDLVGNDQDLALGIDGMPSGFIRTDNSGTWASRLNLGTLDAEVNVSRSDLVLDKIWDKGVIVVSKTDSIGKMDVSFETPRYAWEDSLKLDGYYTEGGKYYVVVDVVVGDRVVGSVGSMKVAVELGFAQSDPSVLNGAKNLGALPSYLDQNGVGEFSVVDVREVGKSGNQLDPRSDGGDTGGGDTGGGDTGGGDTGGGDTGGGDTGGGDTGGGDTGGGDTGGGDTGGGDTGGGDTGGGSGGSTEPISFTGTRADNTFVGGAGDDKFLLRYGTDVATGGDGADTFNLDWRFIEPGDSHRITDLDFSEGDRLAIRNYPGERKIVMVDEDALAAFLARSEVTETDVGFIFEGPDGKKLVVALDAMPGGSSGGSSGGGSGSGDSGGSGASSGGFVADFTNGADGFVFVDDAFGNTNAPGYARGVTVNGAVDTRLGGIDDDDIFGMSGGWQTTFESAAGERASLTINGRLILDNEFERGESVEMRVSVDGVEFDAIARIEGTSASGVPDYRVSIDDFVLDLGVLEAGSHTLTIGGYLNKKTFNDEVARIRLDSVELEFDTLAGANAASNDGFDFV